MLVLSLGFGPVFVGVTTAANAGVPSDKAGLAAALLNASQQLGGALGLAIFAALATSHTLFLVAAAIGLRATNTRGETDQLTAESPPADRTVRVGA
jgi:MFS family permease